jgi:hypothetical protein
MRLATQHPGRLFDRQTGQKLRSHANDDCDAAAPLKVVISGIGRQWWPGNTL